MKKAFTTLYARAKNGKIKLWNIETNYDEIIVSYGYHGGAQQKSVTKAKAKNVGKSNETSASAQAIKEAEAKWKKQHDKSYTPFLHKVDDTRKNPMLASDYSKRRAKLEFPVYVQPKLDGVRCLARLVGDEVQLTSRGGKVFPTAEHLKGSIRKHILKVKEIYNRLGMIDEVILDGELYIHNTSLQEIVGFVKKPKKGSEALKFVIFDLALERVPYYFRLNILDELSTSSIKGLVDIEDSLSIEECQWCRNGDHLYKKVVSAVTVLDNTKLVICPSSLDKSLKIFVEVYGYEGAIIRSVRGLYEFDTRSSDLLKYKKFFDSEFEIVDIEEGNRGSVILVMLTESGKEFRGKLKGTIQEVQKTLLDRENLIGKSATVQYQARTLLGIPQFPVVISVRDYE